jgi:GTP-binding protein
MAISAVAGSDVRKLLYRAAQRLAEAPPPTLPSERPTAESELPIYRPEEDPRTYTITRTPAGFRVSGQSIERAAAMTYWEEEQSIRRFQRILQTLGVEDALRRAGAKQGDTVFIGDEFELEWSD